MCYLLGRPMTLAHDNLEEFLDPVTYDEENRLDEEREFFLDRVRRYGGPVLDLACGTGRLTKPIAETGVRCVGVDLSDAMLRHAEETSRGLPIDYVLADCREVALEARFGFVLLTGNAFQGFLTDGDQRRLFSTVADHLRSGGGFAFETRNPSARVFTKAAQREWERSYPRKDGTIVDVHCITRFDPMTDILHVVTHRHIRGGEALPPTRIALRYSSDAHCRRQLAVARLSVVEAYGDFFGAPLGPKSPSLVYVCERR
ncbi:MAG: class I SAM-dependent methyltransferase [Myxococcota bacterium]